MKSSSQLTKYRYLAVGVLLVVVAFILISQTGNTSIYLNIPIINSPGQRAPSESSATPLADSRPVQLLIPKINVSSSFVDLGITGNQEIEIPKTTTEVGWYKFGPTPGELGPAIILGHVDSKEGPGVFFYLGQLEPGDIIEVLREDGSIAEFRIDGLERYEQNTFPTSLVYGDIDHAGLRLITCSGSYDREQQRYDYNLVVYASLIDPNENTD